MQELIRLIEKNEDWLLRRVLGYAKARNYTKYTSTLEEAWRLSITGLSASLVKASKFFKGPPELGPDEDYENDPITSFGTVEAQRHRARGVSLSMFLGLMKYYRQSYVDLIEAEEPATAEGERHTLFIHRCFDRIEIAFCTEWARQSQVGLITELQTTNRMMTNEKTAYLTAFESLSDPVFILDDHNRLINLNLAAARLIDPESVPGESYYRPLDGVPCGAEGREPTNRRTCARFISRNILELLPWLWEAVKRPEKDASTDKPLELRIPIAGSPRYFEAKLSRMLDVSEKFTAAILTLRDVTERRLAEEGLKQHAAALEAVNVALAEANTSSHRANLALESAVDELARANEELAQRNTDLDEFSYVASHDLQEPLRKLVAFSQLLRKDIGEPIPEQASRDIAFIIDAARRMQTLVQDLLRLSRAGRNEIRLARIAMGQCADRAIDALATRIAETGAEITRDRLPMVVGDATMLTQLYQNLIGNAMKFVPTGQQPIIRLTCERENGRWVFGVRDNGIGIRTEHTTQIFAPFKRLHGANEYEGSGIGLAICRKTVERHGGRIWVDSELGRGSHFRFMLSGEPEMQEWDDAAETTAVPSFS